MLRTTTILTTALIAILLALPATFAAAGTPGPFVGVVAEGDTTAHAYDNNPTGSPCPQVMATYTVTLSAQPATDTLVLSVGDRESSTNAGVTGFSFADTWCTSFTIKVTGADVEALAAYEVTVTRTTTGAGGPPA